MTPTTAQRTAAAHDLSPRMVDSLLTALTSQGHYVFGTRPTQGALMRRGLAETRTTVNNHGHDTYSVRLTPKGRETAAVIAGTMTTTERAPYRGAADSEALRLARLGDSTDSQPYRAVTTIPAGGTPIPAEYAPLRPARVLRILAESLMAGAVVTRVDAAGTLVKVEYTSGLTVEYRAVDAPAMLPGVVARLGEARPAFAYDTNPVLPTSGGFVYNLPPVIRRTAADPQPAPAPDSTSTAILGDAAFPRRFGAVQAMLRDLKPGQSVVLRESGRDSAVTVQRGYHHPDGMGAPGSHGVTVGYGPGRYNTFVSIDAVTEGYRAIGIPAPAQTPAAAPLVSTAAFLAAHGPRRDDKPIGTARGAADAAGVRTVYQVFEAEPEGRGFYVRACGTVTADGVSTGAPLGGRGALHTRARFWAKGLTDVQLTAPAPAPAAAPTFPPGAPVVAVNLAGDGFYYATVRETLPTGWLVVSDATGKTLELSADKYTLTAR